MISKLAVFIVVSLLVTSVFAETKSLKCSTGLPDWKINDLIKYSNCPSGVEGIGKPWLWDTFTFDADSKQKITPVEVSRLFCHGKEISYAGKATFTPSYIIFEFTDTFGSVNKLSVNRKTLENNEAGKCVILEIDNSDNKI
jgi:hypothetical protein